jgi:DNA polymerase-1
MKTCERVLSSKEPARLWLDQTEDRQVEAFSLMRYEMPEASLSDVDPAIAIRYAGRDPDATRRVKKVLLPRLQEMGLEPVYRLDLGTLPILDRMMTVGMQPDHAAFKRLAGVLDDEIDGLRRKLISDTGINEFNPNSGDQTAVYIYEQLGLDMLGKRTDSGRGNTNDKVLEALEKMYPEYPAIADIRHYRKYYKLRWTFVERLPELVERWPFDGRIHCELMLTRTPSGRLAAKNPNLLAMPKHGKYAKLFRACFVPREGCMFVSADESQVELRGLAHLSQDPTMCAIFRGDKRNPDGSIIDLHAATAQRIFGVAPKDQDESKHRLPAKAVNFGIPMGMTKVGLCLELQKGGLDVSEDDAQRWIDGTEAMFSMVPVYKQAMIDEAHKNGYVRCFSGRIRYVGGIRSKDDRVRAEAERFAFSTPIQEIAQAVGKRAVTKAWHEVYVPERKRGHYVEPLLWTHDDLLSEIEIPQVLRLARELKAILTEPPPGFSVPLATTPEAGLDWASMVKL